MLDKWIVILGSAIFYLVLLFYQVQLPKSNNSNIVLGVKIPQDKVDDKELDKIYSQYKRMMIIVGVLLSIIIPIIISIGFYSYLKNYIFLGHVVYVFTLFLVYIRYNNKVRNLKERNKWFGSNKKVIAVDLKYSKERENIKSIISWAKIPIILMLGNLFLMIYMYPKLSSYVKDIFRFTNTNSHVYKTPIKVFGGVGFQIFFIIVGYLSYYIMSRAKVDIDPDSVEASVGYNKEYVNRTNKNLQIVLLIIQMVITFLNLQILGIINIGTNSVIALKIIGLGVFILNAYYINKFRTEAAMLPTGNENSQYFYEDDDLWKIGNTLYFNPQDPAIFVKSRSGKGHSVNAARPLGMILLLLAIFIIGFSLLIVVNEDIFLSIINKF